MVSVIIYWLLVYLTLRHYGLLDLMDERVCFDTPSSLNPQS